MNYSAYRALPNVARQVVDWRLFGTALSFFICAVLCVVTFSATDHEGLSLLAFVHSLLQLPSVFAFIAVVVGPFVLGLILFLEAALPRRSIQRITSYAVLLLFALMMSPQTDSYFFVRDLRYAEVMLERANGFRVIGKTKAEVIELLGKPNYVLPIESSPEEEQLRYHHWSVIPVMRAEFLVSVRDGRAEWIAVDPN